MIPLVLQHTIGGDKHKKFLWERTEPGRHRLRGAFCRKSWAFSKRELLKGASDRHGSFG